MRYSLIGSLCFCFLSLALADESAPDEQAYYLNLEHDIKQSIAEAEQRGGSYTSELIQPYIDLARIYFATGRHDDAEDSIRHAQHITHRTDGVLTLQQKDMLRLLFELELSRENYLTAHSQQEFLLHLHEQNLAPDDPELIDALITHAQWLMETGQFQSARTILRDTREQIIEHRGSQDYLLMTIYEMEAKLKSIQGACCAYKVRQQAVEFARRNGSSPDVMATNLMSLGDALIASRRDDDAAAAYAEAQILTPVSGQVQAPVLLPYFAEINDTSRQTRTYKVDRSVFAYRRLREATEDERLFNDEIDPAYFTIPLHRNQYNVQIIENRSAATDQEPYRKLIGDPVQFDLEQLLHLLPIRYNDPAEVNQLTVLLDFTIDERGRAQDIEVLETTGPIKLDRLMKRAISMSYFRPGLEDGRPVVTEHVNLRQTFSHMISLKDSMIISPDQQE